MKIITLITVLFIYSTPILAQNLSHNPWEQENTQAQINSVYQKRNKKLKTNLPPSNTIPTSTSQPKAKTSSLDKLKSFFTSSPSTPKQEEITLAPARKIAPKKINSPKRVHRQNFALTPATPTDHAPSQSAFSLPDMDMDFDMPSFKSNSLINRTKQNFSTTIRTLQKQLK